MDKCAADLGSKRLGGIIYRFRPYVNYHLFLPLTHLMCKSPSFVKSSYPCQLALSQVISIFLNGIERQEWELLNEYPKTLPFFITYVSKAAL